jgi:hypothetical protein
MIFTAGTSLRTALLADAGGARCVPVVDRRQVEVHFAGELRLEVGDLQVDDHVAAQLQVVEEQVDAEFLAADLQQILAADEREADAELEQEGTDMFEQAALQLSLLRVGAQGQEVEVVWVLENLLRQLGLRRRQGPVEVGQGFALPVVEPALDLVDEHVAAPAVLDRLPHVPEALVWFLDLIQENAVVEPRYLCSNLLHN